MTLGVTEGEKWRCQESWRRSPAQKAEKARLEGAKIVYKWYIDGDLSDGGAEEVPAESIDQFVRYWVGQGFYSSRNRTRLET